jgi:methyl acetate hydrolase
LNSLATILRDVVQNRSAPFLVGMVGTSRDVIWSGAAGEEIAGQSLTDRTVFRIVSMSKAIGATAVAILADRGKLSWSTLVEDVLPEFAQLEVLDGYKGDCPQLRKPRSQATLRHLATHTSGLVYGFWNREIARFLDATSLPPIVSGLKAAFRCPMAFDPGTRWEYGSGVDWLGMVVEAVDGRSIERFCIEEIFTPLNMKDTCFELDEERGRRLAPVFGRSLDGGFEAAPINVDPPSRPEFYGMGHALYSTAEDYMRFLRMWLNNGQLDGIRIISLAQAKVFLENQIGTLRMQPLKTALPIAVNDLSILPEFSKSHSLGFARMEEDVSGMRGAGSQFWGGVLNTHFWFDPTNDIAGIFMTQLLPFLDTGFMSAYSGFEREVYTHSLASRDGKSV